MESTVVCVPATSWLKSSIQVIATLVAIALVVILFKKIASHHLPCSGAECVDSRYRFAE